MNKASEFEKCALKRLLRLIVMSKKEKEEEDYDIESETEDAEEEEESEMGRMKPTLKKGLSVCAPTDEFGCPVLPPLPDEAMYLHVP